MNGTGTGGTPSKAPTNGRLAVFAWIAAKLAGVSISNDFRGWTEGSLGHRLGQQEINNFVAPLRPDTTRGRPPKHAGAVSSLQRNAPAIVDSLSIDEQRLGLVTLLFEVPNPTFGPRPELTSALEILPGIRRIVETKEDGDVVALGVVRNLTEADELKARIQELVPDKGVRMRLVSRESQVGAAATWFELARREADDLASEGQ